MRTYSDLIHINLSRVTYDVFVKQIISELIMYINYISKHRSLNEIKKYSL